MFRHGFNLRVQFLLNFHHVLLVVLRYQVYCQTDLTESSASTDSVQVCAAFVREVEVDDHVDCRHVDASGDEVRADQRLELSLPEALKDLGPLIGFHA